MLLPGYIHYTLSQFLTALNTTILHFPLTFSCCLLSMQQLSSALFFDFNSRHSFIFMVSRVSLCCSIQSLCWRVPRLPSMFSQHSSSSSPYTKARYLALIFISCILRSLVLCSSLLNTDQVCFSFVVKVGLLPLALSLSLSTTSRSSVFISICLPSLFPCFCFFSPSISSIVVHFLPTSLFTFFFCLSPTPKQLALSQAVFPNYKFVLSMLRSSSFLVK